MKRKDFSNLKIEVQKEKNNYFEHEDYIAGSAPFLRGINSTMYLQSTWKTFFEIDTISLAATNLRLRQKIIEGYNCFTLNFSSNINTNESGIIVNSVDDMKVLFDGIPLNKIEVNFKSNNASALPFFIFYINIAKELSFKLNEINISIEENSNHNTSENTINDSIVYANDHLPNFSLIYASTQNKIEAEIELSSLLFQAYNQIIYSLSNGNKIDTIASKILFKWKAGDNLPFEISKIRTARLLWAKMMQQFQPKKQESSALKIHVDCDNKYLPSLASILGGVQSITSSNTISKFILEETSISKTVDPLAGSTIIEQTTEELAFKNWKLFLEFIKNESQDILNEDKITPNFIEQALQAAEKKATLEGVFKILKIRKQ